MKLFGFEFKKFDTKASVVESVEPVHIHRFEEQITKAEVVELWIVKWYPLRIDGMHTKERYINNTLNHLAFTSKEVAEEYAEQLRKALKLLGDWNRSIKVERQDLPTNV